jgi:hypothetical protein
MKEREHGDIFFALMCILLFFFLTPLSRSLKIGKMLLKGLLFVIFMTVTAREGEDKKGRSESCAQLKGAVNPRAPEVVSDRKLHALAY